VTIAETRASQSKPDRGVIVLRQEVLNQADELVMSLLGRALLRRRPAN
jgi:acyl dehydratase